MRANTSNGWQDSSFEPYGTEVLVLCPTGETCEAPTVDAAAGEILAPEAGNLTAPMRDIERALERAADTGVRAVRVAHRGSDEPYVGTIELRSDIDLLGGYDATFAEGARSGRTRLTAPEIGANNEGELAPRNNHGWLRCGLDTGFGLVASHRLCTVSGRYRRRARGAFWDQRNAGARDEETSWAGDSPDRLLGRLQRLHR